MLSPTLSRANKLLAEQNRMIREDNEEIIKGLKLSELSLNDLLGIQNVYKTLNKERVIIAISRLLKQLQMR